MDENALIFAEAIVTSKRPDHVSIFETDFDALTENPKRFYADPTLVKVAVLRFKQAGFSVTLVDKFSISIIAPKALYEQTFNISLVAQETTGSDEQNAIPIFTVANSERAGLIDPRQSDFKDLLDGVALARPAQYLGVETPPDKTKTWYVYPHEIPEQLNAKGTLPSAENVMVAVIDSGWNFHHPYFTRFYDLNSKSPHLIAVSNRLTEEYRYYQRLVKAGVMQKSLADDQVISTVERKDYLNNLILGFDMTGHGTAVVSNLLPVAPKVAVTIIKETAEESFSKSAFEIAIRQKASIINCSFVVDISFSMSKQNISLLLDYIKPAAAKMGEAIKGGITVVFGSGNYDAKHKDEISLPGSVFPTVLVVGGAYYDQEKKLKAASYAHGFPNGYQNKKVRAIPHVCGLCAPRAEGEGLYDGLIYCPTPPTQDNIEGGWSLLSGTSLATPQVAGVCALIISVCPAVTPAHVKEILMRTATEVPISSGKTAQGYSLDQITHTLPNGDTVNPGLVNIKRAVKVAEILHFGLGRKHPWTGNVVKAAVEIAKIQLGDDW